MFSTFSTEFSTPSGGKSYTSRNGCRRILEICGLKCGHSAFYKKESRRFFFCFYSLLRLTGLLFSKLESHPGQFSTNRRGEKTGVENGHKRWFSTLEKCGTAAHCFVRRSPGKNDFECAPLLTGCGTQHPLRALGGTCVLLAAAPTTPPCFRHWRRSSSLLRILSGKDIL